MITGSPSGQGTVTNPSQFLLALPSRVPIADWWPNINACEFSPWGLAFLLGGEAQGCSRGPLHCLLLQETASFRQKEIRRISARGVWEPGQEMTSWLERVTKGGCGPHKAHCFGADPRRASGRPLASRAHFPPSSPWWEKSLGEDPWRSAPKGNR